MTGSRLCRSRSTLDFFRYSLTVTNAPSATPRAATADDGSRQRQSAGRCIRFSPVMMLSLARPSQMNLAEGRTFQGGVLRSFGQLCFVPDA